MSFPCLQHLDDNCSFAVLEHGTQKEGNCTLRFLCREGKTPKGKQNDELWIETEQYKVNSQKSRDRNRGVLQRNENGSKMLQTGQAKQELNRLRNWWMMQKPEILSTLECWCPPSGSF